MSRYLSALVIAILAMSSSCEKDKKKDIVPIPGSPSQPIVAQNSVDGILDATVDIRTDGILLHIAGTPEDATLTCVLNEKPIDVCHDGALLMKPANGDHKIAIIAKKEGNNVAFGEVKFTILPDGTSGVSTSDDSKDPLYLVVDSPNFTNGMPLKKSLGFVAKFKFAKAPNCEPVVKCKYDSRTSPFWVKCDSNTSFSIPKEIVANGLQYLSVQAGCGDTLGPILSMFWYGVPDNYEPLLLVNTAANDRNIVNLARSEDCPQGQQTFQCAKAGASVFENCKEGNVIDKPNQGDQVRIKCNDKLGPIFTY